jgi:hypothetical protein
MPSALSGSRVVAGILGLLACCAAIAQPAAQDTPVDIISDHISRQGFTCDEPRQAKRDEQASKPNGAVWILLCANAAYRVTLIPDMAAHVELIR